MDLTQNYRIDNSNITYKVIDNEAVILNLDTAHYYGLNKTGTEVWEFIQREKNPTEIVEFFKKEYPDIPEKQLKNDLSELIKTLEKEKLITPASH